MLKTLIPKKDCVGVQEIVQKWTKTLPCNCCCCHITCNLMTFFAKISLSAISSYCKVFYNSMADVSWLSSSVIIPKDFESVLVFIFLVFCSTTRYRGVKISQPEEVMWTIEKLPEDTALTMREVQTLFSLSKDTIMYNFYMCTWDHC